MEIFRNTDMEKEIGRQFMMLKPGYQVPELARQTYRVTRAHKGALICYGIVAMGTLGLMYVLSDQVDKLEKRNSDLEDRVEVLEMMLKVGEYNDNETNN